MKIKCFQLVNFVSVFLGTAEVPVSVFDTISIDPYST